jgi:hypothetical protein
MPSRRPLTPCEGPPGQQQQQQQQQLFFPSYQARYHSGQTLSGSYNRASSCSSSADPWQPLPYDPSHTNLRISSDLSSPHSVYSPVSSLPQCRSPASPAYPARNSPSLDRTIPSSRGTMQLPYARTSPSLFPYDVQPEPKTKKRRKRLDPRQLEALSEMYTRTEYPSTEQRQRLADDLNLPSRRVQVWLVHSLFMLKVYFLTYQLFSQVPEQKAEKPSRRSKYCQPFNEPVHCSSLPRHTAYCCTLIWQPGPCESNG